MNSPLLDLIFPPRCAFCGKPAASGVCPACEAALPRMKKPLRKGEPFGKCAVPLRYDGMAREALLGFKFRRRRYCSRGLAALTAQCAAEELGGEFDCVTWVPVSKQRLKSRGYDQAYLLSRDMARVWETKPLPLLKKRRDNPPQSGLSEAERRANVLGAYEAARIDLLRGARVLLVDDVVTTGATLAECARTLMDAGAQSVVCACFASASTERRGN